MRNFIIFLLLLLTTNSIVNAQFIVSSRKTGNLVPRRDSVYDLGKEGREYDSLFVDNATFTNISADTLTLKRIEVDTIAVNSNTVILVEDSTYFSDDVNIAGKVGIGENAPDSTLEVNGSLHITGNSLLGGTLGSGAITSTDLLTLNQSADNDGIQINGYDDRTGYYMKIYNSGVSGWIVSNQDLILASSDDDIVAFLGDNAGAKYFDIRDSDYTRVATIDSDGNLIAKSLDASDGNITDVGDISLDTISSDAGTSIGVTLGSDAGDDFNIDSGGFVYEGDNNRVGIGEASPDSTLEVNGSAHITGNLLVDGIVTAKRSHVFDWSGKAQIADDDYRTFHYEYGDGYEILNYDPGDPPNMNYLASGLTCPFDSAEVVSAFFAFQNGDTGVDTFEVVLCNQLDDWGGARTYTNSAAYGQHDFELAHAQGYCNYFYSWDVSAWPTLVLGEDIMFFTHDTSIGSPATRNIWMQLTIVIREL